MKKVPLAMLSILALTSASSTAGAQATNSVNSVYIASESIHTKQLDVIYPQLAGLASSQVEHKLNALLKTESVIQPKPGETYTSRYHVDFYQGDILNISISGYDYTGGAHGMPNESSYIFNLNTGKQYAMKDLFQANKDYLSKISDLVRGQDKQKILDSFQKFTGVKETDGFRLRNNGFSVYFAPYQWTAYVYGFPTYNIQYSQVPGLVNQSGDLWKSMNAAQGTRDKVVQWQDLDAIQKMGYTPDEKEMAFVPSGQEKLYAWVGSKVVDKVGDTHERIFFFLGNHYLGTDTTYSHDMVSIYPSGKDTITADYAGTNELIVHFRWNGKKITPDNDFHTYHSWYKN